MSIEYGRQLEVHLCSHVISGCFLTASNESAARLESQKYRPIFLKAAAVIRNAQRTWALTERKTGIGPLPMPGRLEDLIDLLMVIDSIPALAGIRIEQALERIADTLTQLGNGRTQNTKNISTIGELFQKILERVRVLPRPMCSVPLQGTEFENTSD